MLPRDGGECVSCLEYCNGMTEHCFGKHRLLGEGVLHADDFGDRDVRIQTPGAKWLGRNSGLLGLHPERDEPVCVNCGGNTVGLRCERCEAGYFSAEEGGGECRRCRCNGHGDVCDRLTGEDCLCKNNTVSDLKPCHHASKTACYEFQCNRCKGWLFKRISDIVIVIGKSENPEATFES